MKVRKKAREKEKKPGTITPKTLKPRRLHLLDAIRGFAITAMIIYHAGFDLNLLGWTHQDINHDLRWLLARALILGTFLFTVGASFAVAEREKKPLERHLIRIGRLALCALLVTLGSWLMFPQSAIYFGTLHAIATMSLMMLLLPNIPALNLVLGAGALFLGNTVNDPVFDEPILAWIGFMTHKPFTEDYVPIFPWFGLCLIGYGVTNTVQSIRADAISRFSNFPRLFTWAGRHSLAIYLLHQPILLGILSVATYILKFTWRANA